MMTWLKSLIAPFLVQILGVLALIFFVWGGFVSWQVSGLKANNARLVAILTRATNQLNTSTDKIKELRANARVDLGVMSENATTCAENIRAAVDAVSVKPVTNTKLIIQKESSNASVQDCNNGDELRDAYSLRDVMEPFIKLTEAEE
jgi:hypothetical protein